MFDGSTNRAVNRSRFTFFDITILFKFGINERTLAVLADKNFVRHRYIIANKKDQGLAWSVMLMVGVFF